MLSHKFLRLLTCSDHLTRFVYVHESHPVPGLSPIYHPNKTNHDAIITKSGRPVVGVNITNLYLRPTFGVQLWGNFYPHQLASSPTNNHDDAVAPQGIKRPWTRQRDYLRSHDLTYRGGLCESIGAYAMDCGYVVVSMVVVRLGLCCVCQHQCGDDCDCDPHFSDPRFF
jgi:hypothetical protein